MEIYLMQHGDCLSKEEDPEQPLTLKGKEQIGISAEAMRKMGIRLDAVISSTKKRSLQTARIVAETLGFPADKIIETDQAKPTVPPQETIDFLRRFSDQQAVLVAGHLPSLAEVASFLLTDGSKAAIHFERGGIARIDVEELPNHSGELRWCLTPDQLRLMAR